MIVNPGQQQHKPVQHPELESPGPRWTEQIPWRSPALLQKQSNICYLQQVHRRHLWELITMVYQQSHGVFSEMRSTQAWFPSYVNSVVLKISGHVLNAVFSDCENSPWLVWAGNVERLWGKVQTRTNPHTSPEPRSLFSGHFPGPSCSWVTGLSK